MKFLKENWYKLMTGTAMLIFACGFFIYAVSPSYASYNGNSPSNNDYALVPLNKDGSINIKISEETTEGINRKKSFLYDFMSSLRQKINDPLNKRADKQKEISQR